jgi:hypothetical protein
MAQVTRPPIGPDCRGAIVSVLDGDADVSAWYAGGNYASEEFTQDVGAFNFMGEFDNMCTRIEIVRVDPDVDFEIDCAKYAVTWNVWVFYGGGSDALAANLLSVLEMVLKGVVISLANPDGDTVVVRQIRFLGRGRVEPFRDMWRLSSMFRGLSYYI